MRLDDAFVENPIGMEGSKLQAGYWFVTANRSKVSCNMGTVTSMSCKVDDIIVSSVASAVMIASEEDKKNGVIVIDIGSGTIDYVAYSMRGATSSSHPSARSCSGRRSSLSRSKRGERPLAPRSRPGSPRRVKSKHSQRSPHMRTNIQIKRFPRSWKGRGRSSRPRVWGTRCFPRRAGSAMTSASVANRACS